MAKIRLYGYLKQFGDKFDLNVETASEGLNGLYCQIAGLRQRIIDGWFRVRINGVDITDENLAVGLHSRLPENAVIHIVPHVAGAKSGGIFGFIAGAALVVGGLIIGVSTGLGFGLVAAGAGLMLGGVAQMLTPLPKTEKRDSENNSRNTSFSNIDNRMGQGFPVQLTFGTILIGSHVLSQGIETRDESDIDHRPILFPPRW